MGRNGLVLRGWKTGSHTPIPKSLKTHLFFQQHLLSSLRNSEYVSTKTELKPQFEIRIYLYGQAKYSHSEMGSSPNITVL